MQRSYWILSALVILMAAMPHTLRAAPPPPDLAVQAADLLGEALPATWPLERVSVYNDEITICLNVPVETLREGNGLGVERVNEYVRIALTPLDWRVLRVHAPDPKTGQCQPLSDFLPSAPINLGAANRPEDEVPASHPDAPLERPEDEDPAFSYALEGKTVYVSAGHGWLWNGYQWRTQRIVYQEFIEDHNNAEVVLQYLIPYLEQAGATVIPARERDWNTTRVIVDNDAGAPSYTEAGQWITESVAGYADSPARLATAVTGTATATATWQLAIPEASDYALYAWVGDNSDYVPDAHYTIHHAGGTSERYLNQRVRPATWRYLGTYPFYAEIVTVTLDNSSTTTGTVVADALRLGGGLFDDLTSIETTALDAPNKPWWEVGAYYYVQWMGMTSWSYLNDVVARPIYARWNHASSNDDAVFISWHSNGYAGVTRGTESYVHNEETHPRTEGSLELQEAVHSELIHDIRVGWEADWVDRGKKQANLGEVRMLWDDELTTRIPGTLIEVAFHDEPTDAAALKDPRFNQLAARAVYQGLLHYFETRDGVDLVELPEPPTHLQVQNVGGGQVRVSWSPSPTDTMGLRGDAATAYRVYTSPDGFVWRPHSLTARTAFTLTERQAGETLYVRVTALNAGGESFPTEVLGARVGPPSLLIVNGFDKLDASEPVWDDDPVEGLNRRLLLARINARNYTVHHGQAVPSRYAWDSASDEALVDGHVTLTQYKMVDWILGEENGLAAEERAVLESFLSAGNALFISGSNLAQGVSVQDPQFLWEVLHIDHADDDAGTYMVAATENSAFEGLAEVRFDAPDEYDADQPDVFTPTQGANIALTYVGGAGGAAAVQYTRECTRVLALGFPFEVLHSDARQAVMRQALDFLDECAMQEIYITSPMNEGVYNTIPEFKGITYGKNLTQVAVQVMRARDGRMWTGTEWGEATWLTASGTLTWHYALPILHDDVYTLSARTVNEQGVISEPARVVIELDVTSPLTPTPAAPTAGQVLTTTEVALHWDAPYDTGTSLTYQLMLDEGVHTVTDTVYTTTSLATGEHQWRVRARDAASNVSPWSMPMTFTMILPARVVITSPVAGHYYSYTPTFAGQATGTDLTHVEVQIIRTRDWTLWNGTDWHTTTSIVGYTWITATGTTAWTYAPMPVLDDGKYILRARAWGATDPANHSEVMFTYDNTAPLTPTLITPTNGITLTTGPIALRWHPLENEGTPFDSQASFSYYVRLDDTQRIVTSTTYTQNLQYPGAYRWRVRAVDAAGNSGPWTQEAHFNLVRKYSALYLPLLTRNFDSARGERCWTAFADGFESEGIWNYNNAERVQTQVHEGEWAARVGIVPGEPGGGSTSYSAIYRIFSLPPDVGELTLRYAAYSVAENEDPDDKAYVSLKTEAGQTLELAFRAMSDTQTWEIRTQDLNSFASGTLVLYLGVLNDGDEDTAALYLDVVEIVACRQ